MNDMKVKMISEVKADKHYNGFEICQDEVGNMVAYTSVVVADKT